MNSYTFLPIGTLKTIFREKFGVPRQSGMVNEAKAILKLNPHQDYKKALHHLEDFSHVWIIFIFHRHDEKGWKPLIHPPREDAPSNIGVSLFGDVVIGDGAVVKPHEVVLPKSRIPDYVKEM